MRTRLHKGIQLTLVQRRHNVKCNMNELAKWMFATCRRAAWAPILVFGLHVIFSRVLGAYLILPSRDIPMHFFDRVAITYFFADAFAVLRLRVRWARQTLPCSFFSAFSVPVARLSFGSSQSSCRTTSWALAPSLGFRTRSLICFLA